MPSHREQLQESTRKTRGHNVLGARRDFHTGGKTSTWTLSFMAAATLSVSSRVPPPQRARNKATAVLLRRETWVRHSHAQQQAGVGRLGHSSHAAAAFEIHQHARSPFHLLRLPSHHHPQGRRHEALDLSRPRSASPGSPSCPLPCLRSLQGAWQQCRLRGWVETLLS